MKVKNCTLLKALNCDIDEDIVNVAKILKQNKQRRIIVIDNNQVPLGIISTTDMNNKVVAENKDLQKLKAKDIMLQWVWIFILRKPDMATKRPKIHKKNKYRYQ